MIQHVYAKKNWHYHRILNNNPAKAYVSLGSNLGDRENFLERARDFIRAEEENQILKMSSLYETEPVDCPGADWFLNQVIQVITLLTPRELLASFQEIELKCGRQKREKNGPREIDIDLLLFGDLVIADPDLQVPHPRLHERRFVLEPLAEIDPLVWHPVLNKTAKGMLNELAPLPLVRPFVPAVT